uniref:Cyclin N-terminal domain-containing protein n=1 Tax=Vitrella brassicaformis TaxID=1169539 RepID=A0A7S1P3W3_9ALVE|mmetsp:Transcript_26155/g.64997  ORF Transcript_26155/g.64997 Transcript_26155/m.64997 type:complete len:432 (+) Transcript_26155:167-1462(+)
MIATSPRSESPEATAPQPTVTVVPVAFPPHVHGHPHSTTRPGFFPPIIRPPIPVSIPRPIGNVHAARPSHHHQHHQHGKARDSDSGGSPQTATTLSSLSEGVVERGVGGSSQDSLEGPHDADVDGCLLDDVGGLAEVDVGLVVKGCERLHDAEMDSFLKLEEEEVLSVVKKIETSPHHSQLSTVFDSSTAPSITLSEYLKRILTYGYLGTHGCIVMFVLISRVLLKYPKIALTLVNGHRLFLTAALTTTKAYYDKFFDNLYWSKIGGISLVELNILERVFLRYTDFRLRVTTEEYCQCLIFIKLAAKTNLSPKALSTLASDVCLMVPTTPPPAFIPLPQKGDTTTDDLSRRACGGESSPGTPASTSTTTTVDGNGSDGSCGNSPVARTVAAGDGGLGADGAAAYLGVHPFANLLFFPCGSRQAQRTKTPPN